MGRQARPPRRTKGWCFLAPIPLSDSGVIAQFIGETRTGYEWLIAGIAALVGGWLGSEAFGTVSTWGPEVENFFVLPALIGGVVVGGVVDAVVRTLTGGSFVAHARPI